MAVAGADGWGVGEAEEEVEHWREGIRRRGTAGGNRRLPEAVEMTQMGQVRRRG